MDDNKKYEKQGIWVLTPQGAKRFEVEIGLSDDNKSEIISNEIKEHDKVIISSSASNKKKQQKPMGRPF